ncbi:MAG: lysine--tRNA ligase [Actinomycetota bacterium]|nr:lysine--tRNA ligase [Actinomycetota bacterium]
MGTGEVPEQVRIRRGKRDRLLAAGVQPYPVTVPRTHRLAEVRQAHQELPPDTATGERVSVAGRVMFLRNTGKLCFATLQEGGASGTQLQAMLSLDKVGAEALAAWKTDVDLGDHVVITGEVITSKRGELSVLADEWRIASKALRPLPVAYKELSEETRVRQRYVDLIVRSRAGQTVRTRSATVRSLRESLQRRGYIEVETPMLQTLHGGATARPFVTHSNALDTDLYLRISPELFLKRAVVGGIDRVFELSRVFRNEGGDSTHSPEFSMLEVYEAYGSYDTQAVLTRELIQEAAQNVCGSLTVTLADGSEYDLSGEWDELTMYGSLSEALGEPVTPDTTAEVLRAHADRLGLQLDPAMGHGKLVEELWEQVVGSKLSEPTFVRDFPLETSPLTREHRAQRGVAEKWDLYVRGIEVATAYSELIDPVVQRDRLTAQSLLAAGGDPEAMQLDEDFLRALEYGMPPSGGMGMGVDRLLMVLTGLGIRETVLFPLVRRE